MTTYSNKNLVSFCKSFANYSGPVVILVGVLVLYGRAFDIQPLKSVFLGLATMKVNTALSLILTGAALWLVNDENASHDKLRVATICAAFVVVLGLLTLGEYIFKQNLGIDPLIFRDSETAESAYPGRMALTTALNFVLLGVALIVLSAQVQKQERISQALALIAGSIACLALISYLYGVESLYGVGPYRSMAIHTAFSFILIAVGIFCLQPQSGLMQLLTTDDIEGHIVRRLLPIALGTPVILGWLSLWGQRLGLYSSAFGLALMVILTTGLLSLVLWWNARWLHHTDANRRRAEQQILQMKRLYAALSQVNQTIVRVKNRDDLYQKICHVAVKFGEFSLAWIGLVDEESGDVHPVTANGLDLNNWPLPVVNVQTGAYKDTLLATAVRTSQVMTSEAIQTNKGLRNLYDEMEDYASYSAAAIPFLLRGRLIGVLSLLSKEEGLFKADAEVRLLEEMGLDISFALDTLQSETERKHAEEMLRESEQKYSLLFEKSPLAISLSRLPDGVILDINEAFEHVFGFKKHEVIGRTSLELGINPDVEGRARILAELNEHGSAPNQEVVLQTKPGEARIFSVHVDLVEISGQKYILNATLDITERKRAEEEILKLNEELEQRVIQRTHLFEVANRRLENSRKEIQNILDSMSTLNAKVALDGTLLFVNKIAMQASGLATDELMKTNFLEGQWWAFDQEVQTRVKDAFAQACTGVTVNYDEKIFAFGQMLTINFSLTPMLRENGDVEYILAEGRDITRHILAEQEILRLNQDLERRAAELETVNKELESFSYSVSHDLRAPLRTIDGFSHALEDDYQELLPDQGRDYIVRIRAATQRMAELIDDLLSLARVTRTPLERRLVDLTALADKILEELQREHPARHVTFTVAKGLVVNGDRQLLQIVLENLIGNAWKFTSKREAAHIEVGVQDDSGQQIYFVRDNGAGFDMTYKDKLFGAFQRFHSSNEFPGTGIGLATVQRIIHRHGGRIWAESQLDKGTTFYFTVLASGIQ